MSQKKTVRIASALALITLSAVTALIFRQGKVPEPEALAAGKEPAATPDAPLTRPAPPHPDKVAVANEPTATTPREAPTDGIVEYNRVKAEGARAVLRGIALNRDFPFWSRPLTDANRYQAPAPHHQSQRAPLSASRELVVWPLKQVFRDDEAIVLFAQVIDEGQALVVPNFEVALEGAPSHKLPDVETAFRDDGQNGDSAAGDKLYTATLPISAAEKRAHPGGVGYRVIARLAEETIETTNAFFVWVDNARPTGRFRDAIEDGSLVIYCAVSVRDAASIQLRGELHGPRGEDIGFAWVNADMSPGEHEVALKFYGKVIADRALDGPYQLSNVVVVDPVQKTTSPDVIAVAHRTGAYRAAEFRSDAFNAADPLYAAQLAEYEERLGKALRNELDPERD